MINKRVQRLGLGTLVLTIKNLHFMSTVSLQKRLLVCVREIVVVAGEKKNRSNEIIVIVVYCIKIWVENMG